MPPDLPGLYYDPDKKRYFPTASRPAGVHPAKRANKVPETPRAPKVVKEPKTRPLFDVRLAIQSAAVAYSSAARQSKAREIECAHLARNHTFEDRQLVSRSHVTALCLSRAGGILRYLTGDANGWVYTPHIPDELNEEGGGRPTMWISQVFLRSRITSICMSEHTTVYADVLSALSGLDILTTSLSATSLGPNSQILIRNDRSLESMFVLHPPEKAVHDIWTASIEDRSMVLGASKKAVLVRDLEVGRFEFLHTQSDVLAVCQQHSLAYTGTRNGRVARFDLRARTSGEDLFADATITTTVTSLNLLREFELLVARINGSLVTHDLRYAKGNPLRSFAGHSSTYSTKLPVAVDVDGRFVFAAGEDHRVRVWSVDTGQLLPAHPSTQWGESGPFGHSFDDPVAALHVDSSGARLRLRLAVGREILQYGM